MNRVVPAERLAGGGEGLARELADGATAAFGAAKKLVLLSGSQGLEAQMELEARAIADAARWPTPPRASRPSSRSARRPSGALAVEKLVYLLWARPARRATGCARRLLRETAPRLLDLGAQR